MPIRSASDVFATAVAWLPLCLLFVGVLYFMAHVGLFLEINSEGTEHFLPNSATPEKWNAVEAQQHQQTMTEFGLN